MKQRIIDIKFMLIGLMIGTAFYLSIYGLSEFDGGVYHYISFGLLGLSFLILKTIK